MLTGISGSKQVLSCSQASSCGAAPLRVLGGHGADRLLADRVGVLALDAHQVAVVGHRGVGAAERLGDEDGRAHGEGDAVPVGDRRHLDVAGERPGLAGHHRPYSVWRLAPPSRAAFIVCQGERGALHPHRELVDAGEDGELAELGRGGGGLRRVGGHELVEALEEAPRPRPRVLPLRASVIIEAEAVEIEQPVPSKLTSAHDVALDVQVDGHPVAAQRVVPVGLAVRLRHPAEVPGVLASGRG